MKKTLLNFKFIKQALAICTVVSIIAISCGKKDSTPPPPPADKTALQKAVDSAQMLQNNTVEGTKPGQYEAGTKAPLTTALDASKAVLSNDKATQADVNNTVAQLNAAITTYQGHLIQEIAAANLIGYWKMNGNANDSSGKGNDGTVKAGHAYFGAGLPTLTKDRFNRDNMAYHFDKGGNIEVPYKTELNPPAMSISIWAKWASDGRALNTDTYTMVAMNRWNGYKFQLQSGHLPFYTVKVTKGTAVGDTTIYDRDDAGVAVPENEWHHLVVTFTSGVESFYIDGDLVKTWDSSTPNPVPGNAITLANPINFVIGQDLPTDKYTTTQDDFYVNWGGFWTGDLDDVMFYNVALTGPQVKSIYTNQKTE